MSVKSLKKQLMAAIATTMVGAVALSSSTYAWFAINSKVTATGMNFKTQVSDNLFITGDELGNTATIDDNKFGTSLVQNVNGLLEPVSTIDGTSFFYSAVSNVIGNGDTKVNEWTAYSSADTSAFDSNYTTTGAVGYVDYVYRLKAINGGSERVNLTLTDLTLNYYQGDNSDFAPSNAFRAAVFVEDISNAGVQKTATGAATANYNTWDASANSGAGAEKNITAASIYRATASENFSENDGTTVAATPADGEKTTIRAVASTTELKDVAYNADTVITVPANSTCYYKVVVRVWLEGEDTTCNNTTFAKLDDGAWALDCGWTLGNTLPTGTTKVESLKVEAKSSAAANGKVEVQVGTTIATSETVAGGTNYYAVSGKSVYFNGGNKQLYVTAAIATTSKFYVIINDGVNDVAVDVTNLVTVTE